MAKSAVCPCLAKVLHLGASKEFPRRLSVYNSWGSEFPRVCGFENSDVCLGTRGLTLASDFEHVGWPARPFLETTDRAYSPRSLLPAVPVI